MGGFNLHELPVEEIEAGSSQSGQWLQGNGLGKEFVLPVLAELAQDIADRVFIDQRVAFHHLFSLSGSDACLIGKGNLGIGNDG